MSNYCNKCKVNVDSRHQNCPLCGAFIKSDEVIIINRDADAKEYIDYGFPKVNIEEIIKHLLFKIAIFISIICIASVLIVDLLATGKIDWSLHIVVGIGLFWLTLGRALFFKWNLGKQAVWDCLFAILLVIYIQYAIGELNAWWGYQYAIPSLIIAFLATLGTIMLMKWPHWAEYSLSATILCILTYAPLIYSFAMYRVAHFMTYICAGFGTIVLLFMVFFGKKSYFLELKKKFHI